MAILALNEYTLQKLDKKMVENVFTIKTKEADTLGLAWAHG